MKNQRVINSVQLTSNAIPTRIFGRIITLNQFEIYGITTEWMIIRKRYTQCYASRYFFDWIIFTLELASTNDDDDWSNVKLKLGKCERPNQIENVKIIVFNIAHKLFFCILAKAAGFFSFPKKNMKLPQFLNASSNEGIRYLGIWTNACHH